MSAVNKILQDIIATYEASVKTVDSSAKSNTDRAYGGVIRSAKGKLQEYITESLVRLAWQELSGAPKRLVINPTPRKIDKPIHKVFKPLEMKTLKIALEDLKASMKKFV